MAKPKQIPPLTFFDAEYSTPCKFGRTVRRYLAKGQFRTASEAYNKASRQMQKLLWEGYLDDITEFQGPWDSWGALDQLEGWEWAFSGAFKVALKREIRRLEDTKIPKRLSISITKSWERPLVYEITVKRVKR